MKEMCNKTYLITGASGGIGKSIAHYLTFEKGANVVLVARHGDMLRKILSELPGDNLAIEADLTELDSIGDIFEKCKCESVRLDGMVYAAGMAPLFSIRENDTIMMENTMKLNAMAFAECCKYMIDEAYTNRNGSIVAISSITSIVTSNRQSAYAASKAMMNTYVRFFAKEAVESMRVNAVLPAVVETELFQKLEQKSQGLRERTEKRQPLGIIQPEYVSKLIGFLLSDDSKYMTGNLINMDSGFMLF